MMRNEKIRFFFIQIICLINRSLFYLNVLINIWHNIWQVSLLFLTLCLWVSLGAVFVGKLSVCNMDYQTTCTLKRRQKCE